jgi:hypothetical protein
MDTTKNANLHILKGTAEEQKAEAMRKGLVQVPPEEAEAVGKMSPLERKAWLKDYMAKNKSDEVVAEAARKLRNKNKAARKARKDARRARRGK